MTSNSTSIYSRNYEERVYAGVLGKIIGVYLGRPFEQWSNEAIEEKLGEVNYYVHDKLGSPLIVTDDDITGTFIFLRALSENGYDPDLTAAQIGDWWLNSIIENKTILWWGGLGISTEHTAYVRLKSGMKAPESGSIAVNGRAVAEEIGSQIFIDGWGMICPGDPERAADFARRAASVSHDGEAIFGAQVMAAMEALAFVQSDLDTLLDAALSLIPRDCIISQLIGDMRGWAAEHGDDWRATLRQIHKNYSYKRFGTNCPMVSNHAIIMLALLHGQDNFQRSLMIANTAGYDTDCNSGNVGCLLGIKNGLATLDAGPDWRGPVADRLYLPTADGGRAITDAVRESYEIINTARGLAGLEKTSPKNGARFHFSLPGSVQGFLQEAGQQGVSLGHLDSQLCIQFDPLDSERAIRVATATFTPPEALTMGGYELVASPTLYSGQKIVAALGAGGALSGTVSAGVYIRVYGKDNVLEIQRGPVQTVGVDTPITLEWTAPDTKGQPIAEVGIEVTAPGGSHGSVLVDSLTWTGTPETTLGRPEHGGNAWERAWVSSASCDLRSWSNDPSVFRVVHNDGVGLATQGESCWTDYTVSTEIYLHMADRAGLLACVQGLRRYVALVFDRDRSVRLIEQRDDEQRVLCESDILWEYEDRFEVSITVKIDEICASIGETILRAHGSGAPRRGAVGMMVDRGYTEFGAIAVRPA